MYMDTKKTLISRARELLAIVDFAKWIDSCDASGAKQMEYPFSGVALDASLSDLFALAHDNVGWMLAMHAKEGQWLAHLPLHSAYLGFGEGLVLVTDAFTMLEEEVPAIAVQIFVPKVSLVELLGAQTLLGFGLGTDVPGEAAPAVQRVNRLVPLYTPERYEAERRVTTPVTSRRLFAR
jgi:hypothetical protein